MGYRKHENFDVKSHVQVQHYWRHWSKLLQEIQGMSQFSTIYNGDEL